MRPPRIARAPRKESQGWVGYSDQSRAKSNRIELQSTFLLHGNLRSADDATGDDWAGKNGREHGTASAKKRPQMRRLRPQRGFREAIRGRRSSRFGFPR